MACLEGLLIEPILLFLFLKTLSCSQTATRNIFSLRFGPVARVSLPVMSTPQQKCIGWPEQKYINDAGEQGPELGAFVRHQTWAGLSAGVSELARRERLLL